ncbi:hypothetical protein GUITHDRAFT_104486 [Guillardia theta CCMP2712]|uniref:Uncharacterized protein n=1 Tax=Guillardia theta (strain CCMP2712) TaxID=905079 RepID=L1JM71_GUITC|nr:hypothetical protein GUITHDRAFT_104486 [Guillardia theta CCMP2712]EKX49522.1 hypothetical protein GUITHDRAFT_104486 [Guillardia theta CCMP2712]|eukprot:XP_005836502.1 hypothetical protein GUITHDRAFT_104486 [Guillardia theta CCMP2712]
MQALRGNVDCVRSLQSRLSSSFRSHYSTLSTSYKFTVKPHITLTTRSFSHIQNRYLGLGDACKRLIQPGVNSHVLSRLLPSNRPHNSSAAIGEQKHLSTSAVPEHQKLDDTNIVQLEGVWYSKGDRSVGYWLIVVSGMVIAMVVLGGLTRLTGSGLSMVKWKPHSEIPPMTEEEWMAEFEEFKTYPEWIMKRQYENFTLQDFKFIYYMEWSHRMFGRLIGVVFTVPLVYFASRGYLKGPIPKQVGFLFTLGGLQGLVGWWMVKSGLQKEKMQLESAEDWQFNTQFAAVSPYRLTAHLSSAITIYMLLFWFGLGLIDKRRIATACDQTAKKMWWFRQVAHGAAAFAGLTAFSGGFVAGNHAGLAYNDWPLMGGRFIPKDLWEDRLGWRNFTEHIPAVQFNHRMLAYSTLTGALATFYMASSIKLPKRVNNAMRLVAGALLLQISLGVGTLWGGVPVELAASHQAGSLVVLSSFLWLLHTLRYAHPTFRLANVVSSAIR